MGTETIAFWMGMILAVPFTLILRWGVKVIRDRGKSLLLIYDEDRDYWTVKLASVGADGPSVKKPGAAQASVLGAKWASGSNMGQRAFAVSKPGMVPLKPNLQELPGGYAFPTGKYRLERFLDDRETKMVRAGQGEADGLKKLTYIAIASLVVGVIVAIAVMALASNSGAF